MAYATSSEPPQARPAGAGTPRPAAVHPHVVPVPEAEPGADRVDGAPAGSDDRAGPGPNRPDGAPPGGSDRADPDGVRLPPSDGLVLDLRQRDRLVELQLAGDLDLATAPRLAAAMAWLRRRYRRTIVVDTRRLDFVDLAGYRALRASLQDPDGTRDPRIVYVVGEALGRLLHHLTAITGALSPRLS